MRLFGGEGGALRPLRNPPLISLPGYQGWGALRPLRNPPLISYGRGTNVGLSLVEVLLIEPFFAFFGGVASVYNGGFPKGHYQG